MHPSLQALIDARRLSGGHSDGDESDVDSDVTNPHSRRHRHSGGDGDVGDSDGGDSDDEHRPSHLRHQSGPGSEPEGELDPDGDGDAEETKYIPHGTRPLDIPTRSNMNGFNATGNYHNHLNKSHTQRHSFMNHASTSASGQSNGSSVTSFGVTPKAVHSSSSVLLAAAAAAAAASQVTGNHSVRLSFSQQCSIMNQQAHQHDPFNNNSALSTSSSGRYGSYISSSSVHASLPLAMPVPIGSVHTHTSDRSGRNSPVVHTPALPFSLDQSTSVPTVPGGRRSSLSVAPVPVALLDSLPSSLNSACPFAPPSLVSTSASASSSTSSSHSSHAYPPFRVNSPSATLHSGFPSPHNGNTYGTSFTKPPLPPPKLEEIQSYEAIQRWPPHIQTINNQANHQFHNTRSGSSSNNNNMTHSQYQYPAPTPNDLATSISTSTSASTSATSSFTSAYPPIFPSPTPSVSSPSPFSSPTPTLSSLSPSPSPSSNISPTHRQSGNSHGSTIGIKMNTANTPIPPITIAMKMKIEKKQQIDNDITFDGQYDRHYQDHHQHHHHHQHRRQQQQQDLGDDEVDGDSDDGCGGYELEFEM